MSDPNKSSGKAYIEIVRSLGGGTILESIAVPTTNGNMLVTKLSEEITPEKTREISHTTLHPDGNIHNHPADK